jgi:predicted metal-dependent RNase
MIFKSLCRHAGIGANSYLLDTGTARVVLDSGMHPKHEGLEALPHLEYVDEGTVDSVVLTHAHLDHTGTIPLLLKRHPSAPLYLTPATRDLAIAMLHNSVNVMSSKRIELGMEEYPLFHHEELEEMESRFETRHYERPFDLDPAGTMCGIFHDAGHILGSAAITIETEGKRVLYTGDICFTGHTLLKGATLPEQHVDALIVETTRGAQQRSAEYTRAAEERRIADAIRAVIDRRGSVLIPVFAIGKTQELLTMVQQFKNKKLVPRKTPVYIGGLSTKMTTIYDRHIKGSRRYFPDFEILQDMKLETGNRKRRGPIPLHPGCIYALSSGMMSENTASNTFAAQGFMENPKNAIFFVGYTDSATPGARIKAAHKGDLITMDARLPRVPLLCDVETFDFSGHATREEILDYILKVRPTKTFLVHGDDDAVAWFAAQLKELLPSTEAIVPDPGESYTI